MVARLTPTAMQPSNLRVALFSGNYNYVRDGANQALNRLVGHLLARGVNVRIYSPTVAEPAFPATGDLVHVPAVPLPGRGEYRMALGLPARVRRDLAVFDPNLIHVSAPDILGHRAVSHARARVIPAVASLQTRFEAYARYYRLGFLEPVLERLSTRFYNRFDHVLVPSLGMAEIANGWGVTTPITIWSRGVDHDRFSPEWRDEEWRGGIGIAEGTVVIGFLGRLVKEKGLDVFADVIDRLKRRGVPHGVLVIGEGPARGWFAEHVPEVRFTGFLAGDELGRAVASMDVLFQPSVTETFGNVTLEAMAAGVPVVAARASGAVGLVDDGMTGRLIDPDDLDGYAEALAALVADAALRRSMGEAGHAKAAGFRWDVVNEAVLQTYLKLMENR